MTELIIGILFSFILTIVLLPILIKFAAANKLFVPESYRKIHHSKVSSLGGLAIFVSSTLSFILFSDLVNYPDYRMIISSAFLLFIIGLRDDLFEMTPINKLFGQFISVVIVVIFAGVRINFLCHHISGDLGIYLDIVATIVIIIGIINAYNMVDGVDMLAALVGIIILSFLGIWFYIVHQYDYSLALLSISSALFAFVIYNYSPAKIFMGDTGTMTIGLIMSVSLIQFDKINMMIDSYYKVNSAPAIAFALISLIVVDMIRVSVFRLFRGKSPFMADKSHIHHLLLSLGWNSKEISIVIALVIVFQIVVSLIIDKLGIYSFGIVFANITILLVFYAMIFILFSLKKRKNNSSTL